MDKLYNKHLNDKGVLLILSDYQYLCQLCDSFKKILGEKYMTKIFIKFYIISKLPFLGVFSVQKMFQAKEPVNPENEKLLSYELNKIDDKYCFSKPIVILLANWQNQLVIYIKCINIKHIYINYTQEQ